MGKRGVRDFILYLRCKSITSLSLTNECVSKIGSPSFSRGGANLPLKLFKKYLAII